VAKQGGVGANGGSASTAAAVQDTAARCAPYYEAPYLLFVLRRTSGGGRQRTRRHTAPTASGRPESQPPRALRVYLKALPMHYCIDRLGCSRPELAK
jgi:hypothetical protein